MSRGGRVTRGRLRPGRGVSRGRISNNGGRTVHGGDVRVASSTGEARGEEADENRAGLHGEGLVVE